MTDRPPPDTASVPVGERLQRLLFGGFLATHDGEERKLGTVEAVPAMGLDGLGSSAYGPEAALTVLLPLGALGLAAIGPIMLLLVALLLAVGAGAGEVSVGELEGVAAEGEGRALGTLALAGAGGGGGALVGVPEVGAGDLERVAELEDFVLEVGEVGVGVFSADDRGAETLRAGSCGRGGGLGEPLLGLARAGGEGGGGSSAGGGGGDHVGGRHVCLSWWWWFLLLLVLMLMWWWW